MLSIYQSLPINQQKKHSHTNRSKPFVDSKSNHGLHDFDPQKQPNFFSCHPQEFQFSQNSATISDKPKQKKKKKKIITYLNHMISFSIYFVTHIFKMVSKNV